jgi:nitrogen fixation protein FixH
MIAMTVKAQLTRPASDEGQRHVQLNPNGPGRYEIVLPALEQGIWSIELTAESPSGEQVTAHKSLTWKR